MRGCLRNHRHRQKENRESCDLTSFLNTEEDRIQVNKERVWTSGGGGDGSNGDDNERREAREVEEQEEYSWRLTTGD